MKKKNFLILYEFLKVELKLLSRNKYPRNLLISNFVIAAIFITHNILISDNELISFFEYFTIFLSLGVLLHTNYSFGFFMLHGEFFDGVLSRNISYSTLRLLKHIMQYFLWTISLLMALLPIAFYDHMILNSLCALFLYGIGAWPLLSSCFACMCKHKFDLNPTFDRVSGSDNLSLIEFFSSIAVMSFPVMIVFAFSGFDIMNGSAFYNSQLLLAFFGLSGLLAQLIGNKMFIAHLRRHRYSMAERFRA